MWIREYPGSFQNRLVSSFFKWVPKYVLFLAKLIGEGRPFWNGKAYRLILWTISYLHVGIILTIVKVFIILFLLVPWEYREHPGNFQNKSVSSAFNWVSRYILFLAKLKSTRREATLQDYPQEHLVVIRDEKVSPFVKFEIILPLLCFLLDPLTNKHCRTWSSMINLWIDSRTCQK